VKAEGLATGYRVDGDSVVVETPAGELRVKGRAIEGRASLGGGKAAAALVVSLLLAALMIAGYPPWSLRAGFAISVAYYGVLLGLAFAAYLSADAARPRRAVIVEGPGYRRAFIVINGCKPRP